MPEGIAYQNKDIEFKLLSETFKEKSFEAYGLDLPRIKVSEESEDGFTTIKK